MFGSQEEQGQQHTEVLHGAASPVAEDVPVARPVIVAVLFATSSVSLESDRAGTGEADNPRPASDRVAIGRTGGNQRSFSAEVGGAIIAGMAMPAPYPIADLEFAIASAWTWPPEAEATTRPHCRIARPRRGYRRQSNRYREPPHCDRRSRRWWPGCRGACAVYWPAGNVVHHPAVFAGLAETASPDRLPLYLWSNYCVVPDPGEVSSLFTVGLEPLGLMEIEVHDLRKSPMQLRE